MTYRRVLLKLSGESLAGDKQQGIDSNCLEQYAEQIAQLCQEGIEVAIVIGGGNIFRGLSGVEKVGIDRVTGDQMGMLATVINSLSLSSALQAQGTKAKVFTSIQMKPIGEPYNKADTVEWLRNGGVAIVAGGTGNPFFTTDTAAALRAVELETDVLLKGTRVNGIYSADPEKDPQATRYEVISYQEILQKQLRVMDLTAITLCMENRMELLVFNMDRPHNLQQVLKDTSIGTRVVDEAARKAR